MKKVVVLELHGLYNGGSDPFDMSEASKRRHASEMLDEAGRAAEFETPTDDTSQSILAQQALGVRTGEVYFTVLIELDWKDRLAILLFGALSIDARALTGSPVEQMGMMRVRITIRNAFRRWWRRLRGDDHAGAVEMQTQVPMARR